MGTSVGYSLLTPGLSPTQPRPDAIAQLLRELTGAPLPGAQVTPSAGVMTGPTAAPLPAPMGATTAQSMLDAMPNEAPRPRMISRIAHSLLSIPGAISEHTRPQLPAEFQAAISAGLLSPEEAQAARPGFLSSIAGDAAQNPNGLQAEYGDRLGRIVQMKQLASQLVQAKQAEAEKQKMLMLRAEIGKRFQVPENASPQQQVQTLMRMYTAYVQAGDTEMAGKVAEVVKSMGGVLEGPKPGSTKAPIELRLGDHVELLDPDTRKPIGSYKINPSPRDPNAPDTAQQLRDQRMFQREQQLADDYNKDTKLYRELHQKLRGAVAEVPAAMNGDGAAQTNILYAFVNAMDPASAVREGEIGLVQSAAPLRARVQQMLQKYLETGKSAMVPKEMVKAMGDLMRRRMALTQDYVNERSTYYGKRGKAWGLNTSDLFPGLEVPSTAAPVPAAPTGPTSAAGSGRTVTVNGKTFKLPE